MNIAQFVSNFTNHPVLFIGTGFSLRYLNNSYTWDGLLSKVSYELFENNETYHDIKSTCKDNDGNFIYNKIGSAIEIEFNDFLKKRENRNNKFKSINDLYYQQMEEGRDISRFKIYLANLLADTDLKTNELSEEIKLLKNARKNIGSIISTNYDRLIEEIFEFNPLIGNDILLSNPYGSLYKIHGCVSSPDKIIITEDDYEKFEVKYELIRAQLLHLFIHNPIIFLGYSLQDDNIKKILKTVFNYVQPNSEQAENIRNNFLLIEYSRGSMNENISDFDIYMENYATIRIKKLATDNYSSIYNALSNLQLRVSAMDIRKVQGIVKTISENATSNIEVHITKDIDSLRNDNMVLAFGSDQTISYEYHTAPEYIAMYFKFMDESNKQKIKLIDKHNIQVTQFFPIYGFSLINEELGCSHKLKQQQKRKLEQQINSIQPNIKNTHTTIGLIHEDESIAPTYKTLAIIWAIWHDQISLDEVEKFLREYPNEDRYDTPYRKLICVYDYKRYHDMIIIE